MSVENTEIETYFGRCRCCLSYGYLKSMWLEHKYGEEPEVYGEMLIQCFALTWNNTEDSMEQDQICEQCIIRLRDASEFKKVVLDSQEELLQQISAENDASIKVEQNDEESLTYQGQDSEDTADTVYTFETADTDTGDISGIKEEADYEEIEYLEDDDIGDTKEEVDDSDSSFPPETPSRPQRRKRAPQPDSDEKSEGVSKTKWPKKLPKMERFKTYKQYTADEFRECMEAVRNGEMRPHEASIKYNIPKKTICAKLRMDPLNVQIDNTTKSDINAKEVNIKTEPAEINADQVQTQYEIDPEKSDIEYNKLKFEQRQQTTALMIEQNIKKDDHAMRKDCVRDRIDKINNSTHSYLHAHGPLLRMRRVKIRIDKMTQDKNIKPKGQEVLVNTGRIQTRSKAFVDKKCKYESEESEQSDVNEMFKHKDNIKAILQNSNATMINTFGRDGYSCNFCDEQKKTLSELKRHNLEAHRNVGDGPIKVKYVTNLIIRLDITDLKCKLCEEKKETLEEFMQHLNNKHSILIHTDIKNHIISFKFDTDTFHCIICKKEFKFFKLLSEHMSEHYRNYECSFCDRAFINKQSLQSHSYRHKKGIFKCSHCPKEFDTRPKRSEHEKGIHTFLGKPRKCAFCDERFSTWEYVRSHEVRVHKANPTVFSCETCKKHYRSHGALKIHRNRLHLKRKPNKCPYCHMAFFSKFELKTHLVTHTELKDFKCDICGMSFGTKTGLTTHVKTNHTDEKRFKCKNCGCLFLHRIALKVHMRNKH